MTHNMVHIKMLEALQWTEATPHRRSTHRTLQVCAVWHNMREEPNVYINGRPYVLREEERPFKNMQACFTMRIKLPMTRPCKGRISCSDFVTPA